MRLAASLAALGLALVAAWAAAPSLPYQEEAIATPAIPRALSQALGQRPRRPARCFRKGVNLKPADGRADRTDDAFLGRIGDDVAKGFRGDDGLFGLSGADRFCGGRGDDTLHGGDNFDRLDGGPGYDTCTDGEKYRHCEEIH